MRTWLSFSLVLSVAVAGYGFAQLTPADIARAAEVERLLAEHGAVTWAGWGPQPLLLRSVHHEYLIAHPAPPATSRIADGLQIGGQQVVVLDGYLTPVPVATTWPVEGVWSVAIPTLDMFQAAIDEILGANVVTLDDPTYIRAVIHEAFHAFQLQTYGSPDALPGANQPVNEREVLGRLQRLQDLDDWHAWQGDALARALEADDPAEVARAVTAFLALREEWRAIAPRGTRILERRLEWVEGLARYADTSLMIRQAHTHTGAHDQLDPYPGVGDVWGEFLAHVREPATIEGGVRDRYYALGAAQAFVLDRLMPDWRTRALPGGEALEDLLSEAVASY